MFYIRMSAGFANSYPYWLGTATTTANAATSNLSISGTSTIIALQPSFIVSGAYGSGGITINSTAYNTASTFSTCLLSSGTYWMYSDVALNSNTTGFLPIDGAQFWISDAATFTATNATAWPDLCTRPYYNAGVVASGGSTPGQGNFSMTYSGWLTLPVNSKVYNNFQYNGTTGQTQSNKASLYNWSFQKLG